MFENVRISGSYYHDGAMERLEQMKVGDAVDLVGEPTNTHDPNSVKVLSPDGGMLGYITASNGGNIVIANLIKAGAELHAFVSKKTKTATFINILAPGSDLDESEVAEAEEEPNVGIITLVQIPVIEERLRLLSGQIDAKVNQALNLVCNEDTVKAVKDARAELNKEFNSLEEQRKAIKLAIMEPYEDFEAVYKEYVSSKFKKADADLKSKIDSVESELKGRKEAEVRAYFTELAGTLGIDFVTFEQMNLKVNLSDSVKKLKEHTYSFLTKIAEDVKMISTFDEAVRSDVMVEFKQNGFNVANASLTVTERNRRKREEAEAIRKADEQRALERQRAETARQAAGVKAPEVKAPQVATKQPDEKIFALKFKVMGTKSQLMELKAFLDKGEYTYESIK